LAWRVLIPLCFQYLPHSAHVVAPRPHLESTCPFPADPMHIAVTSRYKWLQITFGQFPHGELSLQRNGPVGMLLAINTSNFDSARSSGTSMERGMLHICFETPDWSSMCVFGAKTSRYFAYFGAKTSRYFCRQNHDPHDHQIMGKYSPFSGCWTSQARCRFPQTIFNDLLATMGL